MWVHYETRRGEVLQPVISRLYNSYYSMSSCNSAQHKCVAIIFFFIAPYNHAACAHSVQSALI